MLDHHWNSFFPFQKEAPAGGAAGARAGPRSGGGSRAPPAPGRPRTGCRTPARCALLCARCPPSPVGNHPFRPWSLNAGHSSSVKQPVDVDACQQHIPYPAHYFRYMVKPGCEEEKIYASKGASPCAQRCPPACTWRPRPAPPSAPDPAAKHPTSQGDHYRMQSLLMTIDRSRAQALHLAAREGCRASSREAVRTTEVAP